MRGARGRRQPRVWRGQPGSFPEKGSAEPALTTGRTHTPSVRGVTANDTGAAGREVFHPSFPHPSPLGGVPSRVPECLEGEQLDGTTGVSSRSLPAQLGLTPSPASPLAPRSLPRRSFYGSAWPRAEPLTPPAPGAFPPSLSHLPPAAPASPSRRNTRSDICPHRDISGDSVPA